VHRISEEDVRRISDIQTVYPMEVSYLLRICLSDGSSAIQRICTSNIQQPNSIFDGGAIPLTDGYVCRRVRRISDTPEVGGFVGYLTNLCILKKMKLAREDGSEE
jgi:hypothetical protein